MGQTAIAAIIAFLAGWVCCAAFAMWIDSRPQPTVPTKAVLADLLAETDFSATPTQINTPPRRRTGLAEARRRAELESLQPVEHQAQVTQNNTRALER